MRRRSTAFNKMVSLKPSLASYARVSYARELHGRRSRARRTRCGSQSKPPSVSRRRSRGRRRSSGSSSGRTAACVRGTGTIASRSRFGRATSMRSTHLHRSRRRGAGCARAVALERRATETIPLPQFVATLGDLERAQGHDAAAARQYALIGAIQRLLRANGVKTDLETALFDVDHGVRLARRARAGRAPRTSTGRRSTATTCSLGRLRATAAARRRCATRSVRSASARSMPPSSSTAG